MRTVTILLLAATILGCARDATESTALTSPDRDATRSRYASATIEPLGISEPVQVLSAGMGRDGTYSVALQDVDGAHAYVYQSFRRRTPGYELGPLMMRKDGDAEVRVEPGSAVEGAIYGVLIRWAADHPRPRRSYRSASKEERTLQMAHAFLNVMDWRLGPDQAVR